MGTGINGWLEYGYDYDGDGAMDHWVAAVNLRTVFHQSEGFFGSFFGVHNRANFEPVAADRGLPEDPSDTVARRFPDGPDDHTRSHTWLGLDEDIPWDEGPRLDDPDAFTRDGWRRATRTHRYTREGALVERNVPLIGPDAMDDAAFETLKRERRVVVGDDRYESHPISRFDAGYANWRNLLDAVRSLDSLRARENAALRIVVWFDS